MQASREKISKLSKDIKTSQKLIDRARTKKIGILANELRPHHVRMSFILGNKDTEDVKSSSQDESKKSKPLMQYFVISQHNILYLNWRTINTIACLTSSYFYAYMAAFERSTDNESLQIVNNVYEAIFVISMVLQFLVDYTEDG